MFPKNPPLFDAPVMGDMLQFSGTPILGPSAADLSRARWQCRNWNARQHCAFWVVGMML